MEWASFLDHFYGTPQPDPPSGYDVLLEIEVQGARQVRGLHPDALIIFVAPPSVEEQQRRLRGRGEPEEVVARRVAKAAEEEKAAAELDAITVINDDLDRAVAEISSLIQDHRPSL